MYLEHGIWSLALCVLVGMFYTKHPPDRNPTWIVWFAVLLPDTDFILQVLKTELFPHITTTIATTYLVHGGFHNVFVLIVCSFGIGWLIWKTTKIAFKDAAFCIAVGFTAHLLEDALVNGTTYHFYRPFSERGWYQGYILHPFEDVVFANNVIASTNVVYIGLLLLALTILIRSFIQGDTWLKKYDFVPFLKRSVKDIRVTIPLKIDDSLTFYGLNSSGLEEGYKLPVKPVTRDRPGRNISIKKEIKNTVLSKITWIGLTEPKFDDERFD
jgi:membrane-bound metal-dependent hydrolase YbcI (DUF457 family)